MNDVLVDNGDIVVMQQASTVESEEVVAVWLKDEQMVILKVGYRGWGRIRLQSG